jgi:two-component system chemotaxis response regulator CheY
MMRFVQNGQAANYWLVVEDDESEYFLLRRACRSVASHPVLLWLRDGAEAQSYLSEPGVQVTAIVSDLRMPHMNGLELLEWVKRQERLSNTPFFVLSNSHAEGDVRQALHLGATDYKVKPRERWMLVKILEQWAASCAGNKQDPSLPQHAPLTPIVPLQTVFY